jgi:hypothetical protein
MFALLVASQVFALCRLRRKGNEKKKMKEEGNAQKIKGRIKRKTSKRKRD